VQTRELSGDGLDNLKQQVEPKLATILNDASHSLRADAAALLASWGHADAVAVCRRVFSNGKQPESVRIRMLAALIASGQDDVLSVVAASLGNTETPKEFRENILAQLGRVSDPQVADVVLAAYPQMENDLKPKAVELLTNRPAWSKKLLAAIGEKKLPASVLNINQVRALVSQNDAELAKAVRAHWGVVRTGRDPKREEFVNEMKTLIQKTPGDPLEGRVVYNKLCGQCHKMYGEGTEVGPDITTNGRSSFEQLLSNVFDPSLVIGAGYQPLTVATTDGRVLTGLVVENSDQRIVLKVQGGKLETVAKGEVEESRQSEVSLMPEGIEKQLKPQEIADLFAFLLLDKPPEDREAKLLPGAPVFDEKALRSRKSKRGSTSSE
jgi:putative heme-binding domain-containing protein